MSRKRISIPGIAAALLIARSLQAGDLSPRTEPAPTMVTLQDIYDKLSEAGPRPSPAAASAAEVVSGKTFWALSAAEWGLRTGAMPTRALSPTTAVVPSGYYAATSLTSVDADLSPTNINKGVEVFGVIGTLISRLGYGVIWPTASPVRVGHPLSERPLHGGAAYATTNRLPGSFAWANPSVVPPLGTSMQWVVFTPSDAVTFAPASNQVVVSAPALPAGGDPKALSWEVRGDGALSNRWVINTYSNGHATVSDTATGLMWVRAPHTLPGNSPDARVTWTNAMMYCAALNYAGYTGWRLPHVNRVDGKYGPLRPAELERVGRPGAAMWSPWNKSEVLDAAFTGLKPRPNGYYSGTTLDQNSNAVYIVNLDDGNVGPYSFDYKSGNAYHNIWPVRSSP